MYSVQCTLLKTETQFPVFKGPTEVASMRRFIRIRAKIYKLKILKIRAGSALFIPTCTSCIGTKTF